MCEEEDVIKIMLATDIHVGHMERDPIRGEDSIRGLEEVLEIAVREGVDMVLLGGDLFDVKRPSVRSLRRVASALCRHCLGPKPVALQPLSAHDLNYLDPDLNVQLPVFTIHGNHDEPDGADDTTLELLANLRLVNYIGQPQELERVRVSPVLLRKGASHLAIYPLSHVKDARLARLFREGKVEMQTPNDCQNWFNLLVIHQNRANRGHLNYVLEEDLPNFLDLVFWGHEHDSLIKEQKVPDKNFFIIQPGSTVCTSLCAGEALPKHCALLEIHKKQFRLTPIPLQTVRPFIFDTIVLSEERVDATLSEADRVKEFIKERIMRAVDKAAQSLTAHPLQPKLPLLRFNVLYQHEEQNFNLARFGQQFHGVVANPHDILKMKKEQRVSVGAQGTSLRDTAGGPLWTGSAGDGETVEQLVERWYAEASDGGAGALTVLTVRALSEAVTDFTLKSNDDAFRQTFDFHKSRCMVALMKAEIETVEDIDQKLALCKQQLDALDDNSLKHMMKNVRPQKVKTEVVSSKVETMSGRGRGRGCGRGRGRGAGGGTRGRGAPSPRAPAVSWLPQRTRNTPPLVIEDDSD